MSVKQLKSSGGFTLIELMIVVAIIAIIMAVAIPSYSNHVEKTRRTTAQSDLMELAQWMERRYTANYDYRDGAGNAPALPFTASPRDGGTAAYNLTVENVTQNAYRLRAAPTGPQTGDPCGDLTLDQVGIKGDGGGGIACW